MESQHNSVQSDHTTIAPRSDMTFSRFPKFPPEIRQMIWKHALDEPRTMTIIGDFFGWDTLFLAEYFTTNKSFPPPDRLGLIFSVHAPLLALLYTNRESRMVGLKSYELVEITSAREKSIPVYFDFSKDAVGFFDDGYAGFLSFWDS
ncbi:hypothetical protein N431DRAFT_464164 [Stipitochalara longipes BDJ]|nr:hypothetical protein N431DRAFT_464164 [Stipitochalara longipes BDJ]